MRRLTLLVALGGLVLGCLAFVPAAEAWSRPQIRIAGDDRYATAVRLSQAAFEDGAATAVIASGESFPDGLAAGPLAALYDAPVLLTPRDALPAATADELGRLGPSRVLVVGGTAAVDAAVLDQLEAATGVKPTRIAGPSRYATATAVASLFPSPAPTAFVASGVDFPDALAGGAAAAMAVAPLLLTPPDELLPAVGDELARLAAPETLVLGGSGAVSDAVVAAIDGRVAGVRRIAGSDRYSTAAAIAADRSPNATETLLATGETFPDALAAAPLARHLGAPILLTTSCQPSATTDYLHFRGWADVTVIGGTGAVPEPGTSRPCSAVPDGELSPGLTLDTVVLGGPTVVKVVGITRAAGWGLRTTTATGELVGRLRTTEIGRRLNTVLAVNGTFFLDDGEPSYALAVGGRVLKAPGAGGTIVGLDPNKPSDYFFATPAFDIRLGVVEIDEVNSGAPGAGETGMFTVEDGRSIDVGTSYCRATLHPTTPASIDGADTVQSFEVRRSSCNGDPLEAIAGNDVVAALEGTTEGDLVSSLPVGDVVALRWSVHPEANGVFDVIGGNLRLVIGATVASDVTMNSGPFFTERAPRTAICAMPGGTLRLVVVDGRQPGHSIGLTPRELADLLVSFGCIDAMNLDGGGSTALAVNGVLANRPSDDAGQRSVGSALFLEPRPPAG